MLKLNQVDFLINGHQVLKNITLSLETGKIYGLVGPSGIGKSTLLKIIAGYLDASSGNVFLNDKKVYGPKYKLISGHPDIELVNQDFALDIYHTVRENIRQKTMYLPKDLSEELIDEILDVLELTHLQNRKAHQLSGGEQQRLSLGRALAKEPDVMLLDEPFAHLDVHLKYKLSHYLLELNKIRKTTFLLVSHDGEEVMALAEQIIYLNDGEVQRIDIPENYYYAPNSYYEALFFGEINSVRLGDKEILFRPNEFDLDASNESITVIFQHKVFAGSYFKNYFHTLNNEKIVLYNQIGLDNATKITIRKKI